MLAESIEELADYPPALGTPQQAIAFYTKTALFMEFAAKAHPEGSKCYNHKLQIANGCRQKAQAIQRCLKNPATSIEA